jgi:hypothetical protein
MKRLFIFVRFFAAIAGSIARRSGGAGKQRSRADQRRAALHAGMGDVLKIVLRGAISVQRGCDGRNRHPVSAMRAGEEETR